MNITGCCTAVMRCIVVMLVFVLFGCAPSVSVTQFEPGSHGGATSHVDVFTDRANVKRPYKEIGLIIVDDHESGAWGMSDEGSLVQQAITRAKAMGANGIILLPTETQQRNIAWGGAANSVHRLFVRASAIAYTDRG